MRIGAEPGARRGASCIGIGIGIGCDRDDGAGDGPAFWAGVD
jgi:hypothetical protein